MRRLNDAEPFVVFDEQNVWFPGIGLDRNAGSDGDGTISPRKVSVQI